MGYNVVLQEPDGGYVGVVHVTLRGNGIVAQDRMIEAAIQAEARYKEGKGAVAYPGKPVGRAIVVYEAKGTETVITTLLRKMVPTPMPEKVWTEVGGSYQPAVG